MEAKVGDRIVVKGHSIGDPDRDAEILEVRGPSGTPPFMVRWDDTGHETLFFPGPDAMVEHLGPTVEGPTLVERLRAEHRHLGAGLASILDAVDALDALEEGNTVPDQVHEAHQFLASAVVPHAEAEDQELYPVIGELLGSPMATAPMARQHVEIEHLVERLGDLRSPEAVLDAPTRRELRQVLYAVHAILTLHLATEEELYLPLLEARLSPKQGAHLAEALDEATAGARGTVSPL
jgi:iron-sulfur cluster repair protein YtfE (RIC family)